MAATPAVPPDADSVVDPGLADRVAAEALVLLLQASAGSYLKGGLSLHKQLGARQGRKGRHL